MSTPTTPTTTIATTTTTTTPPDLDVKELWKPLLDVVIRTIEDEQRYIIRDVCDYVPNLRIKNYQKKHLSYFHGLRSFFKGRDFDEVAKFIRLPQDPNESPQESWPERINTLVFDVLSLTAPDFYYQFQDDKSGQVNLYNLMITTGYVVPEYLARNELNKLTYSPRMNFSRFQRKVTEVTSLARRSNYPVKDRDVVMTIIGNMHKSPSTVEIALTAYRLKKYESLLVFFVFLKKTREYGTSATVLSVIQ